MGNYDKAIRDLLSRRDPSGYYVIPVRKTCLSDSQVFLKEFQGHIYLDETIDTVFVKTKSKSIVEKIMRMFSQTMSECISV